MEDRNTDVMIVAEMEDCNKDERIVAEMSDCNERWNALSSTQTSLRGGNTVFFGVRCYISSFNPRQLAPRGQLPV